MRSVCYRLINKTKQQMKSLHSNGNGPGQLTGKTVVMAVTKGGGHADGDLSKLLYKGDKQPDSIFIAKLLESDNKLLGRGFTDTEVRLLQRRTPECLTDASQRAQRVFFHRTFVHLF